MPRFRPSIIPLVLTLSATAWFAARPGFGTLFLALLAFGAWLATRFAEFFLGQLAGWRRRIEDKLGIALEPHGGPAELPEDPVFRQIMEELTRAQERPELSASARRAIDQLTRLPELFARFEAALGEKLNPGEITHQRYLDAGRRVFESTLTELRGASRRLTELVTIARAAIGTSSIALRKLRHEQLTYVARHLEKSEDALTELARISVAVSSMRGKDGRESPELEAAIRDLRELAERSKRY